MANPSTNTHAAGAIELLVEENTSLLQQGIELMTSLPAGVYTRTESEHVSSAVGRHFRHILDLYGQFLSVEDGSIDYDKRESDPRLETDSEYAVEHANATIMALEALNPPPDSAVRVWGATLSPAGAVVSTVSTLERELAHLASHTIHHYAIIRVLLSVLGVKVDDTFGVTPSTLEHENPLPNE